MIRSLLVAVLLILSDVGLQGSELCDSLIRVAIGMSEKQNYAQSIEVLTKAYRIAKKEKSPEKIYGVLTNIGINQAELLNYDAAMKNFMTAYKIASEKLDKRKQLSTLNNIAGLYMIDNKYEKSKEYYLRIFRQIKNTDDSLFIGGCAINIVSISLLTHNYNEASQYLDIARRMVKGHLREEMKVKSKTIEYFLHTGKPQQAYEVAVTAMAQASKMGNTSAAYEVAVDYIKACLKTNKLNEAESACRKLLSQQQSMRNKEELFSLLSDICKGLGQWQDALRFKDSTMVAKESLWNFDTKRYFEGSRIHFALMQREKEIEKYEMRQQTNVVIAILSLIIVAALIWALINLTAKNRQKQKILELERDREKSDRKILQNQLEEEQRIFNHEIEMKGRELVSNALAIANRNDKIQDVITALSESEEVRKAQDQQVNRCLKELQQTLDTNRDWKQFSTYFEQVNSDFINALHQKHPNLTANEIRFLSLVFINLSTKEIALLLSITPEYCKKRKLQIARKMEIESTKLLYGYLNNLNMPTV